jgi:SAM-dependent methyltransferase
VKKLEKAKMREEKDNNQKHRNWLSDHQYMEKHYVPMCRHSGLYQEILDKIVRLVKRYHPQPRCAAEIGCGPGLIIDRLLKVFPAIERLDGYDYGVGLAKIGLKNFVRLRKALDERLFFHEGPEYDLSKPLNWPQRYDLIVNNNVLFIFTQETELRQAVRNLAKALTPDGLLVVSTVTPLHTLYFKNKEEIREELVYNYLLKPWRFLMHMVPQIGHLGTIRHVNTSLEIKITPKLLMGLLQENGLQVLAEDIYYTPHRFHKEGNRLAGGIMYAASKK